MVYSLLYSTTDFQSEAGPSPAARPVFGSNLLICPSILPGRESRRRFIVSAALLQASEMVAFCLGGSNPAWLTPAVTPHPNVDLIKPAAVASLSSIPALSATAPWQFPKLWGRIGVLFPRTKHGVSGTLPRTFLAKQRYRLGRLELRLLAAS